MALLPQDPGNGIDDIRFAASVRPDDTAQPGAAKSQVRFFAKRLKANQFDFAEFEQEIP